MSDLDHHRHELQVAQDEVLRLGQLLSTKDSTIRDLHASKKLVVQELEAARLVVKASEDNCIVLKAQRDKAMDKVVRAGRILMRRPGVVVPNDIVTDVKAAPDALSRLWGTDIPRVHWKAKRPRERPWAQYFTRPSLRGPGEGRLVKWIDARLNQLEPRRPDEFEQRPQQ
jgi:hypothetical protein